MKGTLIAAIAWLWLVLGVDAAPAAAQCGNGKVDVSIRHTCAPCVAGNTNCPCADVRTPLEPCDGRDFDGATCQTQGFFAGTLRCTATCTIDTRRCAKLPGDVASRHRTLGAAPASASLAFSTNVISVGAAGPSDTTITPYNWDLRGPWGKASTIAGTASVISAVLALARGGTSLELFQHDYQGASKSVHSFGDRRALAVGPGSRDGALVALEDGPTSSELVRIDDNGKVIGKPTRVPGIVRAISWRRDGNVVAYASAKGELRVLWLDASGVHLAETGVGPAPVSVAVAPYEPQGAVVVRGYATRVVATVVTFDATKQALAVDRELKLLSSGARVVAAGIAGSMEGSYAILDNGKGTIHAARLHDHKATVKRILTVRGAIAHAATTGYQRIYVAWTLGAKLHLTSISALLN